MTAIPLPDTVRCKEKIVQKYEGTPVSVIKLDTLTISGENKLCKKTAQFYSRLLKSFTQWIETDFESYAKKSFLSDNDPRKKYRYIPLELSYTMTSEDKENGFWQVDIVILLTRNKQKIAEKNLRHIWNLKTGNLHVFRSPHRQNKNKKCPTSI